MEDIKTVKGSQFKQPLLEFSGSCAGCAETSYARLITQVCGESYVHLQRYRLLLYLGRPGSYFPVHRQQGAAAVRHGPTPCSRTTLSTVWACIMARRHVRENLKAKTEALIAVPYAQQALKDAAQKWLDTYADGVANQAATEAYIAALESNVEPNCDCEACTLASDILAKKDYLSKKSVWIFGGDGWAYDIGFGGLDHVLASGEDVNVMVFDTEVYSNTGGQASKATNIGAVAQFAAAGKSIQQEDLWLKSQCPTATSTLLR